MWSKIKGFFSRRNVNMDINIDKNYLGRYDNRLEIQKWLNIYAGNPEWLTDESHVPIEIQSLKLGSAVASELARLTTIELESKVVGDERAEYLNEQYSKLIDRLRVNVEYALAMGGMVFKPFVHNDKILIEIIQADRFIPLEFDITGKLISAIFIDTIVIKNKTYTRLETHKLSKDGIYTITNKAFSSNSTVVSGSFGTEILLSAIEDWEDIEPEVIIENISKPLFTYFKPPFADNNNTKSNLGVSVLSKIDGLLREIDKMYTGILWEYVGTRLAIDVSAKMLINLERLPDFNARINTIYRKLDGGGQDGEDNLHEVFSPAIRDVSLFNGLNELIRKVELNAGLAYGTFSRVDTVEKTAEEIRSSRERSYNTVVDIQKHLQYSLEELVEVMDLLVDLYELAPEGEYEMSFKFDDSIVVGIKNDLDLMFKEVRAGILKEQIYLMKRYGVTYEEATDMMPEIIKEEPNSSKNI